MKNKIQLITYVDRLSGHGLPELKGLLNNQLSNLFGGVHLLPFYYPIDGADAGFDPIDHTKVDERLGNWDDVKAIGEQYDIMADLIVNHTSAQSPEFQDVLKRGRESEYWDLFITRETVFPGGMTDEEAAIIYRPRPGSCFSTYTLSTGEEVEFWTTFTSNQIDINVESEAGKAYLNRILDRFEQANIKLIRLDAAGYAIKRRGTRCFMLEETFNFIAELSKAAEERGMTTLVEIHSHYQTQIEIAKRCSLVYDFALPPLVLHTLLQKDATALVDWLQLAPRNCITVLDTHDGIGIIDVGPDGAKSGLLKPKQIDDLVEKIHQNSHGDSLHATGNAASNVDLYQVNCTYYDALGGDNYLNLLARAIQFFAPGIPQVYYGGLLGQKNDMPLLNKTNVGRDINRPYLDTEHVEAAMNTPFTQGLCHLIKLRNEVDAFNGDFSVSSTEVDITLTWSSGDSQISLNINMTSLHATVIHNNKTIDIANWLS